MREVTGSSPVVSTKKTHPFVGVFFWYYTALTTGLEGGSRFVGTKRFALKRLDTRKIERKGRR